jgi:hypothetical protein
MTTLERIDQFRRLWSVIIPQQRCPEDAQIWRWVSRFDDSVLEHGLGRLRTKILKGEVTTLDSAGRYLTAVLTHESQRRSEWEDRAGVRS